MPGLHGLPGGVLVSVLAYFPFLYLPVAAQLRRLDPAMEDAAASLGHGPWRVFFRVSCRNCGSRSAAARCWSACISSAEYGLYVMIRFDTFTTAIVDQFQSAFNGPAANMLAACWSCAASPCWALEALLRGDERYARVGSGAARDPRRSAPRPAVAVPASSLRPSRRRWRSACRSSRSPVGWLSGGAAVWRLDAIGIALRPDRSLFAVAGALLTTPCRDARWPGFRFARPAGCSGFSRPATTMSARCRAWWWRWRW